MGVSVCRVFKSNIFCFVSSFNFEQRENSHSCLCVLAESTTASATRLDIEVLANHRKKYEKKYRRNKYLLLKLLTNTDSATKLDGLKKHIKKDRRRKKQITIDLIRYLKLYYNVGSDRSANKRS